MQIKNSHFEDHFSLKTPTTIAIYERYWIFHEFLWMTTNMCIPQSVKFYLFLKTFLQREHDRSDFPSKIALSFE